MGASGGAEAAAALVRLYLAKAMDIVELAARKVLGASAEGDSLRTQMAILRRLAKREPADVISLSREVARYMVKAGRYSLGG
jgi:butyryl-CoA dehydrogenase